MAPLIIAAAGIVHFGCTMLLWDRYKSLDREYQREVGWHRMWTERIMEDGDESR